jgi:LysM domain-containing protein
MTVLAERESTRHGDRHGQRTPVEPAAPRPVPNRLRPPTRRRPATAPRVLATVGCGPRRRPRLPVTWLVGVAAAVAVGVVGLGALANGVSGADVPARTEVVRVQPGESLWEVAERMAPSSDLAAVVSRIKELNTLDKPLTPGQPLTVPAEG